MSLIFLSHIHEEKDFALVIQQAIEEEFSGFVTVFVSSDGKTIPAGSNFLKRIEKGLVECVGAIYLISPKSVKRNWINFELGAVWIRNHVNELNNDKEIPVIPICHSGIRPSELPMPLTNLNSVVGSDPLHLKSVFESIQLAVGGKGKLKTDFDKLSNDINELENKYTVEEKLKKVFLSIDLPVSNRVQFIDLCKMNINSPKVTMNLKFLDTDSIKIIQEVQGHLKDRIEIIVKSSVTAFSNASGAQTGGEVDINFDPRLILKYENLILNL